MEPGFYIVDILPLRHTSGRPHHLEERFSTHDYAATTVDDARVKREAILEARRSKLAARASLARDVELRNRELTERKRYRLQNNLRVAERNRNGILERQRQQCRFAVEKAKEVARLQQIRRLAEKERQRSELERRLRITEQRRAKLLSVPKSKLLANNSGDKVITHRKFRRDASVRHEQWRKKYLDPVVESFLRSGISLEMAARMGFPALVRHLKSPELIGITSRLLGRMHKYAAKAGDGTAAVVDVEVVKAAGASRVFLSAYMLTAHPREILSEVGEPEQALLASAKTMLNAFEQWLNQNPTEQTPQTLAEFDECWNTYYSLFEAWKSKDTEQLVTNMIAHYIEMGQLWESVRDRASSADWQQQLDEQRTQLRDRIAKVGGEAAMERLAEVERRINAAREALENRRRHDSVNPEIPPSPTPRPQAESRNNPVPSIPTVSPPTSPRIPSSPRLGSPSGTQFIASAEQLARLMSAYAPPGPMSNEQLAHEVVMDPDFKIERKRNEMEDRIRDIATKAFFDAMREDFENEEYSRWAPGLLGDIKERLLALAPPNSAIRTEINEVLDIELITQQIGKDVFDVRKCLAYVIATMRKLCAPIRDQVVNDLAKINDLPNSFQHILELLDLMNLDLVNFRLRVLRPYLKSTAIDYERTKFSEALRSGQIGLSRTRDWLKSAVKSLQDIAAQRNPENVDRPENRVRYEHVYNDALLSYLFSTTLIDRLNVPETLVLDVDRLASYQNEIQAITITAALLMLCKNFAAPDDPIRRDPASPALRRLRDKIFALLLRGDTTIDGLSLEIAATVSPSASLPPERQALIRSMVDKTISYKDTVYSLLSRRLQSVLRAHLQTGQFAKKETITSHGFEWVRKELEKLSGKIYVLAKHNREVYAQWYDQIIGEVMEEEATTRAST
ncbi:T-complex protein 11-domain-containing protein [Jimgerdemannia flammicorona]|uniref:T-complex protein 11-domain-containing protein n=1 Tax=Jimgerdemannia flammicorona TaxID=994334 RepID=A0A433Q7J0_9FUNG|nr:T-complex protein 11-domain-containing protein [Jimgerdemannia flammicorona]